MRQASRRHHGPVDAPERLPLLHGIEQLYQTRATALANPCRHFRARLAIACGRAGRDAADGGAGSAPNGAATGLTNSHFDGETQRFATLGSGAHRTIEMHQRKKALQTYACRAFCLGGNGGSVPKKPKKPL